MANEITPRHSAALVETLDNQGIGEMLKPLIREIHLFDSYISGTARLADPAPLQTLAPDQPLTLRREASKFDDNAIQILNEAGQKLGYVPEKDTLIFARLMDAGKMLRAKVKSVEKKGSFVQVGIGIYMVDF